MAMVVLAGWMAVSGGAMVAQQKAAAEPAWEAELHARHDALVKRRGPGTDSALRARLLEMGREDQAAPERGLTQPKVGDEARFHLSANARETDNKLTEELKAIVGKDGWPTIAMVGIDASNAAMLILAHTTDHAWQLSQLPTLEKLAGDEEIDGSMVALVVDKQLVAEHKLQRYGTQFKMVDGQAMMFAVEDPQRLDERRARAFLPPMAAYKQGLAQMYHVQVSDMIVRP
ncbi:MAG: DUF6624 domain-containing protein [Acidobacteriota bacterium]